MPISISGDGTITGVSVGGLPDGCVDNGTLANNSVNSNQIVNGAVGAAEIANLFSSGAISIGGLRIETGNFTSPSSVADAGSDTAYPGARYYFAATLSISGFAAIPAYSASLASGYHEAYFATLHESASTSQIKPYFSAHRSGGLVSQPIYWAATGQAS
tara:strand:- start:49 stop:525 length:477 start_codon:yes stop_codon:yes gene_type:complete